MTIGKKTATGFAAVLLLTSVVGVVSLISMQRLNTACQEALGRLKDRDVAIQVPLWTIKQYQEMADLIINRDPETVKGFEEAAANFDKVRSQLAGIVDTPEETRWIEELAEADKRFDTIFHNLVVPEIEHGNKNVIAVSDAKSDEYLSQCIEASLKLEGILHDEFTKAADASNDTDLKTKVANLLALNKMMFWMVKQYQCQADSIINRDLSVASDFDEAVEKMDYYKDLLRQNVTHPQAKGLLAAIDANDAKFDAVYREDILPELQRILENRIASADAEADKNIGIVEEKAMKIADSFAGEADESVENFARIRKVANVTVIVFSLCAVTVGLIASIYLINSITRALKRIIDGLSSASNQTASAAGQVSASSQALANGAAEAASSVEETTASMEEMSAMTSESRSKATEADSFTTKARTAARSGTEAMGRMSQAIGEIKASADETVKIVATIDEIAFQTNLLALNAAVEAARAGEAGKGFAVVAEEVRNLAQKAAEAAGNTSSLLEKAAAKAENGVEISGEVAESLGEIERNVASAADLVAEINAAASEQESGISQITGAIGQIDNVTQSNAATAEESASASEELSSQAEELKGMVAELQKLVGGTQSVQVQAGMSDEAFHQIAAGRTASAGRAKQRQVIEM